MSTQQQVKKICHKCGKDVAGANLVKRIISANTGASPVPRPTSCTASTPNPASREGCGESPGQAASMYIAGQTLCPACRKRKFKYGIDKSKSHSSGGLPGSLKSLFGK